MFIDNDPRGKNLLALSQKILNLQKPLSLICSARVHWLQVSEKNAIVKLECEADDISDIAVKCRRMFLRV